MMEKWDDYHMDQTVAWACRFVLYAGMGVILALTTACSTGDKPRSQAIDLSVKGSYIPGSDASTRNQKPQGGTDEKSDSTPIQPPDRLQ